MNRITRRTGLGRILSLFAAPGFFFNSVSPRFVQAQRGGARKKRQIHDFSLIQPLMESFVKHHQVAGASLTVAHQGEVVSDHGYGLAVVEKHVPVTRKTVFSIASVTKAITGVAALKLVEDGKLGLEDHLLKLLVDKAAGSRTKVADPRFHKITVHHLLFHGAGFPAKLKVPGEKKARDDDDDDDDNVHADRLYRELLKLPLEFDPGTSHNYSNNGFVVLRLVIERVSGQSYEAYCRDQILAPMGITGMRLEKQGPYEADEAHRYQAGGEIPAPRTVANWLSTSAELVKFASAVAGSGAKSFLSGKTLATMLEMPAGLRQQSRARGSHVGLGWDGVQQFDGGGFRFSKNGGKPGIQAWLEHLEYGVDWALLFNTGSPKDKDRPNPMNEARKLLPTQFRAIVGAT